MGYDTYFEGKIEVVPPLNAQEVEYLQKFSNTRRMDRENGPYFVGGNGHMGQDDGPDKIYNSNRPPKGQPGMWCQWIPADIVTDDDKNVVSASAIEWDGGEKFYEATEWMVYIIQHFIAPDAIAKKESNDFNFLEGHVCIGTIFANGEEDEDIWKIVVKDNVVTEVQGYVTYSYDDD